jgi:hypothetical protein
MVNIGEGWWGIKKEDEEVKVVVEAENEIHEKSIKSICPTPKGLHQKLQGRVDSFYPILLTTTL